MAEIKVTGRRITPEEKKKFEKRVKRFVDQSDRISDREARRLVGILKDAKNEVIQDIRNLSPTEFRTFFLPQLRDRLDARISDYEGTLGRQLIDSQEKMWNFSVDKTDELLARAGIEIPTIFVDPATLEATKTLSAELVRTVPRRLLNKLGNRLSIGLMQQKSISEVVDDMLQDFDLAFFEAERIARTELLRTQSIVQKKRYDQVNEIQPMLKRWIWSHKPDGRPGHADAEVRYTAKPIPYEDPFMVAPVRGGRREALQFPRDPAGSPQNVINCGCSWALVPTEVV